MWRAFFHANRRTVNPLSCVSCKISVTRIQILTTLAQSMGKLNVGCGRTPLPDWINLDSVALAGVDIVADLEMCATKPLPLPTDSIDEFLLSHVLEHIRQPLAMMNELWRIATPNAKMTIRVPYGASDDAFEDPTHVRQMFVNSFGYFSQPYYWKADYGYRGDWQTDRISLLVSRSAHEGLTLPQITDRIASLRNVVREMVAELRCVKPPRSPRREMQTPPVVEIQLV